MTRGSPVFTNLLLAFVLELFAFAAIGYGAYHVASSSMSGIILAVAAVASTVTLWGLVAAPRARHRGRVRTVVVKATVFGAAVAVLVVVGYPLAGVAMAVAMIVNALVLRTTPSQIKREDQHAAPVIGRE